MEFIKQEFIKQEKIKEEEIKEEDVEPDSPKTKRRKKYARYDEQGDYWEHSDSEELEISQDEYSLEVGAIQLPGIGC